MALSFFSPPSSLFVTSNCDIETCSSVSTLFIKAEHKEATTIEIKMIKTSAEVLRLFTTLNDNGVVS